MNSKKIKPEFVRAIHSDDGAGRTPRMTRFRAFVLLAFEAGSVEALQERVCAIPDGTLDVIEQLKTFLNGHGDLELSLARRIETAMGKPPGWMDQPHYDLVPRPPGVAAVPRATEPIVVTPNVKNVLRGLLRNKDVSLSLPDLQTQMSDVPKGSVYPVLQRLVAIGWLTRGRESSGHRRYTYRLTALGANMARKYFEPSQSPAGSSAGSSAVESF